MRELEETLSNTGGIGHAYIVEGDLDAAVAAVCRFCEERLGCPPAGNPDFTVSRFDAMLVEDAVSLRDRQSVVTAGDGRQVIVAAFRHATRDAQNALLKVLEEPSERTHFFLVVPYASLLLPTVRSRAALVRFGSTGDDGLAAPWLVAAAGKRLALAEKLAKDIRDEKKTRADGLALLDALERGLAARAAAEPAAARAARAVLAAKRRWNHHGSSPKLLLESVALALP
jgi:DNA polymerase III delta prime subunit